MKVYVVIDSGYEGQPLAVFSTKEKAKESFPKATEDPQYDFQTIQEFELDEVPKQ